MKRTISELSGGSSGISSSNTPPLSPELKAVAQTVQTRFLSTGARKNIVDTLTPIRPTEAVLSRRVLCFFGKERVRWFYSRQVFRNGKIDLYRL